jgi:ubiquinone/menaquinone biosynthesis C-methylase UbiE
MKPWYESLFENYAQKYESECYVQGTVGECDFIERELEYNKSLKILDIGCGTGRHAIELTKRGYRVTGIDLSKCMLARARQKAEQLGLRIDFSRHDARELPFTDEFDAAILLCGGAFPLMETDEMNFRILQNATRALKADGKFIFTTLSGLFPLFHSIEKFCASEAGEGAAAPMNCTFDLLTFRNHSIVTVEDDAGNKKTLKCNERYYVPSEITLMLQSLGYKTIDIFGAKLGAYSRNDKLTPEDFEMLVIAGR